MISTDTMPRKQAAKEPERAKEINLSDLQHAIAHYLAEGYQSKQIAVFTGKSFKTIEKEKAAMYVTLGAINGCNCIHILHQLKLLK